MQACRQARNPSIPATFPRARSTCGVSPWPEATAISAPITNRTAWSVRSWSRRRAESPSLKHSTDQGAWHRLHTRASSAGAADSNLRLFADRMAEPGKHRRGRLGGWPQPRALGAAGLLHAAAIVACLMPAWHALKKRTVERPVTVHLAYVPPPK